MFTLPDTEADIETDKNGLCRIALRCSYCTETDTNTDSHKVLHPFYRSLSCGLFTLPDFMLIPIRTGNQMATLCYTERFTLYGAIAMPAVAKRSA